MPKTKTYKTTCSYCGVGCGIIVDKDQYGSISVQGDPDHPVNRGMLCSKGRTIHHTVTNQSDRLKHPKMRWSRNHPMMNVSWDQAMDRAAAIFKTFIEKHGPDSVGLYVSGQCLTEEYYIANKIVKGFIGTNNIDTNSRLCMSSAVVGYKKALGEDSVPIAYDDIELADTFFITGANPAWCHPILFRRMEQHKEQNPEVKFIVADPRKTQTATMADLHLQLKPGTDIYLYNAISRILIENNWIDSEFIMQHTTGFDQLRESVMKLTVKEASKICDVSEAEIFEAAKIISESKGFISMWAMGLNQSVVGTNKNLALLNISLITGHIGKLGSGPFSLTGQPNAMGGREVGGLSNMLAAHRDFTNPDHRAEVAKFWGVSDVPDKPGLTATQMFEAMNQGKLKAIWIICTNPLVSLPDANLADAALKKAQFVMVQDISENSLTSKYADLVLPAAGYMEKEGTMTNSERRVSYLPKIVDAPGEARPDVEIMLDFAKRMGWKENFNYRSTNEIYKEHAALTKGTNLDVSGLDHMTLKMAGTVQWPFTYEDQESTERLFTDHKFFTPDQKANLFGVEPENQSENCTIDHPLILTTGRIRDQWHTMTRTGKVKKLGTHITEPYLELNEADAREREIQHDDIVLIYNHRGEVRVKAKISDTVKKGVVFLPMHWGSKLGRANNLTNNLVDPVSKEPDFKFTAVEVVLYNKPKQKIAIVGAGAAAFKFIDKYRQCNTRDKIEVFSNEPVAFYNRVLLPDYISGEKEWENLLKEGESKFHENVQIHANTSIQKIDRQGKQIYDQNGASYTYDKLIICTGSRAFIPPNMPDLTGIHSLRKRSDADKIKNLALQHKSVVIVGGGLLGLELADALNVSGVDVTIVQRANRLMERQLDELAGELLSRELQERDIKILFSDEVRECIGENGALEKIRLKSGRMLDCKLMVFAIGTKPNIEIAKDALLKTGRGVHVNDFMQTSDPDIFALGEIAEHKQQLYGITAAAEQQADLLADHFRGNPNIQYQGSTLMNILKVHGVELCSIGMVDAPENDDEYEEVIFLDKRKRLYKKCIVHQDRLVGCILVGDKSEFLEFKELIVNKTELDEKRMELLRSGAPAKEIIGDLVCSCNGVGQGNIKQCVEEGHQDLSTVCSKTGAGTGCGSCRPEVKAIMDQYLANKTVEDVDH